MKKTVILLVALVMLLSLFGCGKSEEVLDLEEKINSIGEVTTDKATLINSALRAYAALDERKQEQVENYAVLLQAKETLYKLIEEAKKKITLTKDNFEDYFFIDYKELDVGKGRYGYVADVEVSCSPKSDFILDNVTVTLELNSYKMGWQTEPITVNLNIPSSTGVAEDIVTFEQDHSVIFFADALNGPNAHLRIVSVTGTITEK